MLEGDLRIRNVLASSLQPKRALAQPSDRPVQSALLEHRNATNSRLVVSQADLVLFPAFFEIARGFTFSWTIS